LRMTVGSECDGLQDALSAMGVEAHRLAHANAVATTLPRIDRYDIGSKATGRIQA
jgi:hypothetical protein